MCGENYKTEPNQSHEAIHSSKHLTIAWCAAPIISEFYKYTPPLVCSVQNGGDHQQEAEGLYRFNLLYCSQNGPFWGTRVLSYDDSCASMLL